MVSYKMHYQHLASMVKITMVMHAIYSLKVIIVVTKMLATILAIPGYS